MKCHRALRQESLDLAEGGVTQSHSFNFRHGGQGDVVVWEYTHMWIHERTYAAIAGHIVN